VVNLYSASPNDLKAKINTDNTLAKVFIADMTEINKKTGMAYTIIYRKQLDPKKYKDFPQMKYLISKWNERPRKTKRARNIKLKPHKDLIDNTLRQVKNMIGYNAVKVKNLRNETLLKELNTELTENEKLIDQLEKIHKQLDKKMSKMK
jgi:hypothetical protein